MLLFNRRSVAVSWQERTSAPIVLTSIDTIMSNSVPVEVFFCFHTTGRHKGVSPSCLAPDVGYHQSLGMLREYFPWCPQSSQHVWLFAARDAAVFADTVVILSDSCRTWIRRWNISSDNRTCNKRALWGSGERFSLRSRLQDWKRTQRLLPKCKCSLLRETAVKGSMMWVNWKSNRQDNVSVTANHFNEPHSSDAFWQRPDIRNGHNFNYR